jgi:hypothetical protein
MHDRSRVQYYGSDGMQTCLFRVPRSTLQLEKTWGGINLTDINTKYAALFWTWSMTQKENNNTVTAAWIRIWEQLIIIIGNPLNCRNGVT